MPYGWKVWLIKTLHRIRVYLQNVTSNFHIYCRYLLMRIKSRIPMDTHIQKLMIFNFENASFS